MTIAECQTRTKKEVNSQYQPKGRQMFTYLRLHFRLTPSKKSVINSKFAISRSNDSQTEEISPPLVAEYNTKYVDMSTPSCSFTG